MWKDWRSCQGGEALRLPLGLRMGERGHRVGQPEASGSWPQDPERWGWLRGGCVRVGSELGAGSGWMRWTQQVHGQVDGTLHGGPEATWSPMPRQRGRECNCRAPTQK